MGDITTSLRRLGLTNSTSSSLSELATGKPTKLTAYCSSFKCAGPDPSSMFGKKKDVSGRPDDCPDCGHALFYKRDYVRE